MQEFLYRAVMLPGCRLAERRASIIFGLRLKPDGDILKELLKILVLPNRIEIWARTDHLEVGKSVIKSQFQVLNSRLQVSGSRH